MKKRMLPLSLVIGAALTLPSLAMAAPTNTAQADMQTQADMQAEADMQTQADMQAAQTASANSAIETQGTSANSASANQSNPFVINETQTISRASVNSMNNDAATTQLAMPTEIQAQQQGDMQTQAMQNSEDTLLQERNAQAAMIQEQNMQDEMLQESDTPDEMLQEEDMSN